MLVHKMACHHVDMLCGTSLGSSLHAGCVRTLDSYSSLAVASSNLKLVHV